ncbi:MAG: hypothetical protein ACXVRZ_13990 [Gaiellaceae bacterium]
MAIDQRTLEQVEIDLEAAHSQLATGLINPAVSEEAKLLGAAIAQAGAQIALAIAGASEQSTGHA